MNLTLHQNTRNQAISQYTNYFFDRGLCQIGGEMFALNCASLCKLGGGSDAGAEIPSRVQTGVTPFNEGEQRVRSIYVKGAFEDNKAVSLKYDMDLFSINSPGSTSESCVSSGGMGRLKFQGVRSKYGDLVSFEIENVKGKDFTINGLEVFLIPRARR